MPKSSTTRIRQRQLERRLEEDELGAVNEDDAEVMLDVSHLGNSTGSPIIDKLNSLDATEREWGCSGLTHLVREETEATFQILFNSTDAFHRIVQCLCDSEQLVVLAALGLVHACTVSGSAQRQIAIASELVKADILTPLLKLLPSVQLSASDPAELKKFKSQMLSRFLAALSNIINLNDLALIRCLSGANVQAILDFCFLSLVNRDLHSQDIMISSAQMLSNLTEIEPDESPAYVNSSSQSVESACSHFRSLFNGDHVNLLKATMANSTNNLLLRALCINILINITVQLDSEESSFTMIKSSLPVIKHIFMQFNTTNQLLVLEDMKQNGDHTSQEFLKELDRSDQEWKDAVNAQTVILEMLSNLLLMQDYDSDSSRPFFPKISTLLSFSDLSPKFLFITPFVQLQFEGGSTAIFNEDYMILQSRAVGYLQNASLNSIFSPVLVTDMQVIWNTITQGVLGPASNLLSSDTSSITMECLHDLLLPSVGVLQQLAKLSSVSNSTLSIPPDDFQCLCNLAQTTTLPDNIRCTSISALGQLCAAPRMHNPATPLTQDIVTEVLRVLMSSLQNQTLSIMLEAASSIMDVFSEQDWPQVIHSLNLKNAMTNFLSSLNLTKTELFQLDAMTADRLEEIQGNAAAFLEYINSQ